MKLGIIGCGIMGERILRVARDTPALGVTVSGVSDPSADRRSELGAEFPDLPITPTVEDLIAEAECIYIASPPATHLAHARQAIAAGRAVFTEKPLAVSVQDAEAFAALVEAEGARAAVNFIFASSPAVHQLHRWIGDGTVGQAQSVEILTAFAAWPRPWQMDASGWLSGPAEGGFTREVVSHFLFLTRRTFGPLALLSSSARYPVSGKAETGIQAQIMAGDLPVSIQGTVGETDLPDHNIWQLNGTSGSIRLRDWSFAERLNERTGEWEGAPDAASHEEMRPLILQGQIGKLNALVAGDENDLATVQEALDVQRVVEAMLQS
ncbi:Gfo/Idh/MocA family protein [Minwuia sp.]|uniref:Gfo/Idh/MocA family protein n=1 Tax=Minwuia sp. TaxID=2493630 RepID=UPI003A9052DB